LTVNVLSLSRHRPAKAGHDNYAGNGGCGIAVQAILAITRHLIAGNVGADAVDVEIVGAAFGDDQ